MQVIDRAFVRGLMPARDQGGHKGTFGKVYLCLLYTSDAADE